MTSPKDPRQPRKNPALPDIEKLMRNNWQGFKTAQNHSQRRGYLMILNAHIESWLNEPEFIRDLEDAPAPIADGAAGLPVNAELPFDQRGEPAAEAFFYCSAGGVTTELLSKADLDADPHRAFRVPGFVVRLYRKIYATPNETRMHFSSDEAFERHISTATTKTWPVKGSYDVLMDPRGGLDGSRCRRAFTTKNQKIAVKKADTFAEKFGIRFLVAELIGTEDTH